MCQAKKNAVANIKKCIANMKDYDVICKSATSTSPPTFYVYLPYMEYLDYPKNEREFYVDVITDISDNIEPQYYNYSAESLGYVWDGNRFNVNQTYEAKMYIVDRLKKHYIELLDRMFPEDLW